MRADEDVLYKDFFFFFLVFFFFFLVSALECWL